MTDVFLFREVFLKVGAFVTVLHNYSIDLGNSCKCKTHKRTRAATYRHGLAPYFFERANFLPFLLQSRAQLTKIIYRMFQITLAELYKKEGIKEKHGAKYN